MTLTDKQLEGLAIALKRYANHEKCTVISGYAGAGKSTLVKFIIEALKGSYGVDEKDVVFCAFTGKACQVLQKKGNKNVSTLHKLLYEFTPTKNGTFIKTPKTILDYRIIIIDECSMMPMEMAKLLFTYPDIYVICLGDPGQLPPINPQDDNHLLDNPHIFLDEIMRQAAESEIIQLSMKIRNGELILPYKGQEVQVITKEELSTGHLLWADQIICATNNKRIALNNQMRELLGRGGGPQDGDKIICLRNYWETASVNKEPLVNGTIGFLKNPYESYHFTPKTLNLKTKKINVICGDFISDSNEYFNSLEMDKRLILEGESTLTPQEKYKLNSNPKFGWMVPYEFTYGYAITGHKSQRKRMG